MTPSRPKPEKRAPRPPKRIARGKRPNRRSAKRPEVERKDAAWAKAVRDKYGDRCFHYFCGNPATDTHHIIGKKAHPKLRYVVENGAPMCREHHNEAHARPKWFKENFQGWYADRWARLEEARLA